MPVLTPPTAGAKHNVGMGQIVVGRAGDTLEAVLGSCVGVALVQPKLHLASLAHVVLPSSNGRAGSPGKFADTAIPEMLRLLAIEGASSSGLVAKLAGGANMFGNATGPMQVGESNINAIVAVLAKYGFRVAAKDLGGGKGRRITVDCRTGLVDVEVVGQHKAVL